MLILNPDNRFALLNLILGHKNHLHVLSVRQPHLKHVLPVYNKYKSAEALCFILPKLYTLCKCRGTTEGDES